MQLTTRNILGYLVDRQLVSRDSVLLGALSWQQLHARNLVFTVKDQLRPGLFIKQLSKRDAHTVRLMQKDATIQHMLHNFRDFEQIRTFIPTYHGYDPKEHILVSEFFEEATSVMALTEQREQLSVGQAKTMAGILASYHVSINDELADDPSFRFFEQGLPWILRFPNARDYAPEVVFQHIRQDDFLLHQLDAVAATWAPITLIHGDVKLVNFIAKPYHREEKLNLIDWEFGDLGDPLWDLAGLLASYVATGLSYMSSTAEHFELPDSKAFWGREKVIEVWQVIWSEYCHKRQWNQKQADRTALKTVGFMAARLLQSAAELNRVRPEFMAPGVWSMIAEARHYFKQPQLIARQLKGNITVNYDA